MIILLSSKTSWSLENFEKVCNELCELRVKLSKHKKSEPWTIDELKTVLKQLENDKSRDAEGFANEIFKESAAGEDLLLAVLKLMNLIKVRQQYPKIMEKCNISSLLEVINTLQINSPSILVSNKI